MSKAKKRKRYIYRVRYKHGVWCTHWVRTKKDLDAVLNMIEQECVDVYEVTKYELTEVRE